MKEKERSADGTSWFIGAVTNAKEVARAKWTVTALGVFEVFANGCRVGGDDFLKPGFTHFAKTRQSFEYDVTGFVDTAAGAVNRFSAEVGAGWWRDKVYAYRGQKSAFRGILELTYADGSRQVFGTKASDWRCGLGGPVTHSGIFDGEEYDARILAPHLGTDAFVRPEANREFAGEIVPCGGANVVCREDLAIRRGPFALKRGETRIVDFGQNCAAVPRFRFRAGRGTALTALPGEMLNADGTLYRDNLRNPGNGMRVIYTFAGNGTETYMPRFTYFGYRYLALSATGDVELETGEGQPQTIQ